MPRGSTTKQSAGPAARLLAWYDRHARVLPWRAPKGKSADPYRVWLSEIMLQQTTVQAVAGYYRKFLALWPDVKSLADAPLDDVLTAWAGLGYYARARNLHKAAKVVAGDMGGKFPVTFEGLRTLPGVGNYTAGAIAAIAYDLPHAAMDANAERVIARLFAVTEPLPKAKEKIRVFGQSLVPKKGAGDFAQALMDLGSAICTPKRPACMSCPLFAGCEGRKQGIQEQLPVKGAKAPRPLRRGAAFVARDATGAVLLVRRPEKGLLGGMMQPPLGPWTEDFPSRAEAMMQAPFKAEWKKRLEIVRHGFTHFELEIEVYEVEVEQRPVGIHICRPRPSAAKRSEGKGTQVSKPERSPTLGSSSLGVPAHDSPGMTGVVWVRDLSRAALPTVMRKIVAATPARG
jgi:A/G-specific adenine glycosylase